MGLAVALRMSDTALGNAFSVDEQHRSKMSCFLLEHKLYKLQLGEPEA